MFLSVDFNLCLVLCESERSSVSERQHAHAMPSLEWVQHGWLGCFLQTGLCLSVNR